MPRTRTSFQPGNTAAATHGARSQTLRQRFREEALADCYASIDRTYPRLVEANGVMRDLLADELADYRQLREHVNRQGGPVSPRGQLYKAQEMKRARGHDVKASVKLIRDLLADERGSGRDYLAAQAQLRAAVYGDEEAS